MRIVEISKKESIKARCIAAMDEDGHSVPGVTHAVFEGDQIVGAFSVAYAPCLFFWMATTGDSSLGSYRVFRMATELLKEMGHDKPILIIDKTSPFYAFLDRLGYSVLGTGEIFIKG